MDKIDKIEKTNTEESKKTPPPTRRPSTLLNRKIIHRSASAPTVSQSEGNDETQKKRNRTTPMQLQILEDVFSRNPTPNSKMRDSIASQVGMSNRSVQVWFQNRRAKEKKTSLRSEEGRFDQEEGDQDSESKELSPQEQDLLEGIETSRSQELISDNISTSPSQPPLLPPSKQKHKSTQMSKSTLKHENEQNKLSDVFMPEVQQGPLYTYTIEKLKIGNWTRLPLSPKDLLLIIDTTTNCLSWIVVEGHYRCKIETSFEMITSIEANILNETTSNLNINIQEIPKFFLEAKSKNNNSTSWKACNDITESKQASVNFKHVAQTTTDRLKNELMPVLIQVLGNKVSIKDETLKSSLVLKDIEQKINSDLFTHDSIYFTEDNEKNFIRKSMSVPSLPMISVDGFSDEVIDNNKSSDFQLDYEPFHSTINQEDSISIWSQNEGSSITQFDLESFSLSTNSFNTFNVNVYP